MGKFNYFIYLPKYIFIAEFFLLMQLAYLPDKKREYMIDDDAGSLDSEFSTEGRCDAINLDDQIKFDKRNRKRGMLGWFKLRVRFFLFSPFASSMRMMLLQYIVC